MQKCYYTEHLNLHKAKKKKNRKNNKKKKKKKNYLYAWLPLYLYASWNHKFYKQQHLLPVVVYRLLQPSDSYPHRPTETVLAKAPVDGQV